MSRWRPHPGIQIKVLGLAFCNGSLLCMQVTTDSGTVKGVRPLGGGVEFGETRAAALAREFEEELSTGIRITGDWMVIENLYRHEGQQGHEFDFAVPVEMDNKALYDIKQTSIADSTMAAVGWFRRQEFEQRGWRLYPDGLADMIGDMW